MIAFTEFTRSEVEQSIVSRFERQVERHGQRTAIVDTQREYTYDELNRRANAIAHALSRVTGPTPTRVAIYLDKGGLYLAAILAVLKAGHAYVPLDPTFPRDRNLFLVEDADAPVVLTSGAHAPGLQELARAATTIIDIDALVQHAGDELNLDLPISPDALAYIIYTSGSTGKPKGVMQNHRNTLHGCMRRTNLQRIVPDDRMTLFYSCSVMGSVYCIFGALLNGAALLPYDIREAGLVDLAEWLVEQQISIYHSVASLFRQFASSSEGAIEGASVRLVIFGGERVFASDVAAARRVFSSNVHFFTGLGSTETGTIRHFLIGAGTELTSRVVPIGYSVDDVDIVLTTPEGQPVPSGEVGEINVHSPYLALGYWNNEEATQRVFGVVNAATGVRSYRMGDLAQLHSDGLLEHRGRKDFQVKIRGFRVEIGEVEAALQSHAGVLEGAVKAQEIGNDTQLVGYVVPRPNAARPLSARELREFLRGTLPSYMIPTIFVALPVLPRTPNGKVHSAALPLPLPSNELADEKRIAPVTATEQALIAICSELLGRAEIGTNENFFDIGGDSLSATKLVARIHQQLGVKLSMRSVFSARDLEGLAAAIASGVGAAPEASTGLEITKLTRVPATPAQKRMWLVEQLHPGTAAYNISNSVRLRGPLDIDALERALNGVVARHGSLRTTFESDDDGLWQVEQNHVPFALPRTDLSSAEPSAREELALGLVREHTARSLDLAEGPLFAGHLVVLGEGDHLLALSFNHIIYDNIWSSRIFFQELGELYQALSAKPSRPTALAPRDFRFLDYAAWEHARIERSEFGQHLAYWRGQLDGLSTLELPSDHQRPAEPTFRGGQVAFKVPAELRLALLSFNRQRTATVFMSMLASWQLLLHRYSGQDDLAIGTPTGRRYRPETEAMIGLFINNLVLRARFAEGTTFEGLVAQVRQTCIDAFEHDEVPFESLVAELAPARAAGAPPFFHHFFIHRNATQNAWALPGLELEPLALHHGTSKFDLTLSVLETEHELSGTLEYSTDLFERASMERLVENYLTLLAAAIGSPTAPVAGLELLSEAEREFTTLAFNRTSARYPVELGLTGLFKLQVGLRPEAIAVVADDRTLNYGDLDAYAERLAGTLASLGVGPDVLVGVCLQRSARLLIALLGVLKAGGAYVPLDPEYPAERLTAMLEDSRARVLISETGIVDRFGNPEASVLLYDDFPDAETIVRSKREGTPAPDDLAYVIYTSGSTGKPKGVQVTHRGLTNFLSSMQKEPGLSSADVVQAITTVCFDIAALELFLPLIAGARVILGNREVALSPLALQKSLTEHQVTVLQATPVTWRGLLDSGWKGSPQVKVLCGGEAMGADLAERLIATGCEIWNVYGPTETTVWSSVGRVRAKDDARYLGQPIANTQLLVMNAALAVQPIGVPGELMIGGDGLARGYLGRSDLTAERFVASPSGGSGRLYRTGDVAVRRSDGAIEFFGRADHQVKIRGFRVELGDIEAQLALHSAVRQAVVVAREDVPGEKRLIAYCVPHSGSSIASDVLHAHLKALLPHYMIPAAFVSLEVLPLTPNGKIDRKRLPAPADTEAPPASGPGDGGARDDLDRSFLAVWESILRRKNISIDDDFFALGGDSMMAIRLVKELKRATGIDYPLSTVFSAPTIRELVARVGDAAERAASIVHLNSARTGLPIYCLAGVKLYKELADHFAASPVFGVYAKRELAGIEAQDAGESVEVPLDALTQTYADAIARHATQKQLVLAGLSFGGLLALEVAAELNRRGFEISQVAMFDSIPVGAYYRSSRKAIADVTKRFAEGHVVDTVKDLVGIAYERLADSVPVALTRWPRRPGVRAESVQGQAFRKMTASYDPSGKAYAFNALLVKATQKTFGIGARLKHDYGFGDIIQGRLDIVEIDADHRGLLEGAAASRSFEFLNAFLGAHHASNSNVIPIQPLLEPTRPPLNHDSPSGRHIDPSPRLQNGLHSANTADRRGAAGK